MTISGLQENHQVDVAGCGRGQTRGRLHPDHRHLLRPHHQQARFDFRFQSILIIFNQLVSDQFVLVFDVLFKITVTH